jgi:hypothetical protein
MTDAFFEIAGVPICPPVAAAHHEFNADDPIYIADQAVWYIRVNHA